MKKFFTILTTATILAMMVVSCNDKDENPIDNEVRKLPSKVMTILTNVTTGDLRNDTVFYEYDNENRLVKIIRSRPGSGPEHNFTTIYEYTNNVLSKAISNLGGNLTETTYYYADNQIFAINSSSDTMVLTIVNEQLEKIVIRRNGTEFSSISFTYDSDGNMISMGGPNTPTTFYEYSGIKSVFRHVNIPSWFAFTINVGSRYMVSKTTMGTIISNFTYEVDEDGYVTTQTRTSSNDVSPTTYEYILAK